MRTRGRAGQLGAGHQAFRQPLLPAAPFPCPKPRVVTRCRVTRDATGQPLRSAWLCRQAVRGGPKNRLALLCWRPLGPAATGRRCRPALAHYARSLDLREALLRANPTSAVAARNVSISLQRLAGVRESKIAARPRHSLDRCVLSNWPWAQGAYGRRLHSGDASHGGCHTPDHCAQNCAQTRAQPGPTASKTNQRIRKNRP